MFANSIKLQEPCSVAKSHSSLPTIVTISSKGSKNNTSQLKIDQSKIFSSSEKPKISMLKRKKSEGSVLLSPRTVENILTLANDNNRNGTRVSMRDIKKEKQGVTPKISDMRVNGSELTKADRHILPFYRHSLTGATPDCYAGRKEYKRKSGDQITTSKSLFPTGTMSNSKTTTEAQHSWIKDINPSKYNLEAIISKIGRSRVPPYATKWLNHMKPSEMELRELLTLTPQTQHFCTNLSMPTNPFLQFEHQAYLREERKKLKQEKLDWEEYEYQVRKQNVEEYKYRIYEEPKIEREAERKRQEQEQRRLEAIQRQSETKFSFKRKGKKKRHRGREHNLSETV
jgi:hypothetical protein